jgi:hypothetical protein
MEPGQARMTLCGTRFIARDNFHRNGLLKNFDPFSPYRHCFSAALVIPMRTPIAIIGISLRARSSNGARSSSRPLCF